MVEEQLTRPVEWLSSMPQALGIRNHYRRPEEHGSDRWFNALGSRRFTQNACIVVSCGTAVTTDALTEDNHYLGGTIMPGFHLMKEAMALKTANLNRPIGKVYPFPTTNAERHCQRHDGCRLRRVNDDAWPSERQNGRGQTGRYYITGGGAARVVQALPESFVHDNQVKIVDNLVIHGLLHWIAHRNGQ